MCKQSQNLIIADITIILINFKFIDILWFDFRIKDRIDVNYCKSREKVVSEMFYTDVIKWALNFDYNKMKAYHYTTFIIFFIGTGNMYSSLCKTHGC